MKALFLLMSVFLVSACAHKSACEKKSTGEQQATSSPSIAQSAISTFLNVPGLNDEQRQKLMEIYRNTYVSANEIRTQIAEHKTTLFKLAATQAYESKQLKNLRDKITALDQRRLVIMYRALEDVQKVVGYGPGKEDLYKHLRDYDSRRQVSQAE